MKALPEMALEEPTHGKRLEWETELLGFAVTGHPLEMHDSIAWETYCPLAKLGEHMGEEITTCGLIIEQRLHHEITGEPMKFLTLADRTGIVETELFSKRIEAMGWQPCAIRFWKSRPRLSRLKTDADSLCGYIGPENHGNEKRAPGFKHY